MIRLKPKHPRLNSNHPLARGLDGAWFFTEGGGTIIRDLSRNGFNGTLGGTVDWGAGQKGVAHRWTTDANTVVTVADNTILEQTKFSVVHILRTTYTTVTQIVVNKYQNSGAFPGWSSRITTSQKFGFYVGGSAWTESTTSVSDGYYRTLIGTYDGTNVNIYVDGRLEATQAQTASLAAAKAMNIGNESAGGGNPFRNGHIAAILYYGRAISGNEARDLHLDPYAMLSSERLIAKAPAVVAGGAAKLIGGKLTDSILLGRLVA